MKQGVGSTVHCVAGDATGSILAAVITASVGLPMWLDLIVECATGFGFGLAEEWPLKVGIVNIGSIENVSSKNGNDDPIVNAGPEEKNSIRLHFFEFQDCIDRAFST